jgi:hypothetical protein
MNASKMNTIRIAVASLALGAGAAGLTACGPAVTRATAPPATTPATPAPAMTTDPNGQSCQASDLEQGYCPGDAPPPSPTVNPATTVTFTVTGWGNPSITYGSDSDNRDGGGQLGEMGDGNALPWTRSVKFSGDAMYYSVSAQLEGSGDISCKIVVTGPGDDPLTVASGHASGSYNICSAQAAPDNADGTSWTKE